MNRLRILLIEPFFSGSHAAWAEGLRANSQHEIEILSLPGQYWKWRMRGGAISLARIFAERPIAADLILASDMLDLPTFLALTRRWTANVPTAIYFHENQINYPLATPNRGERPKRGTQYGLLNFSSALAADALFFNSEHNRISFLDGLPNFLQSFPDFQEVERIESIQAKSSVLPLGLSLRSLDTYRSQEPLSCPRPLILWNHRWEHDKNPKAFFRAMQTLQEEGFLFSLAVLGECPLGDPADFRSVHALFKNRVQQFGFVKDRTEYARWLWEADLLPVTSNHDFFGASVAEAIYCETEPLLPNRLAYPELLPLPDSKDVFYTGSRELLKRLRERMSQPLPPFDAKLRQQIARFDWTALTPLYDKEFERLCTNGG